MESNCPFQIQIMQSTPAHLRSWGCWNWKLWNLHINVFATFNVALPNVSFVSPIDELELADWNVARLHLRVTVNRRLSSCNRIGSTMKPIKPHPTIYTTLSLAHVSLQRCVFGVSFILGGLGWTNIDARHTHPCGPHPKEVNYVLRVITRS